MTLTLLWLLGRLGGSVWANLLQKRLLLDGTGTGRLWLATYGFLALPAALLLASVGRPTTPDFWFNALAAAGLDLAGNLAMVAALRVTDLSVFGPLNAFRPVLALLFGWLFLGEVPTAGGTAGVTIIMLGAVLLFLPSGPESRTVGLSAVWVTTGWRVLGLGLSTWGAVYLKRAVVTGSAELTLGVWVLGGWLGLLAVTHLTPLSRAAGWNSNPPGTRLRLAGHAAVFFGLQWLTLKVFERTLLAYSFAFFQLGMVLQVLLGRWLFHEPHFLRRLGCCLIMSLGAVLVILAG